MKDAILDFIEDHRVLCIVAIVLVILICIMFGIRSSNLKKKAAEEAEQAALAEIQSTQTALEQDTEAEVVPSSKYQNSLGLDKDKNKDERIEIETETETVVVVEPVQTEPTYSTVVTIYDHTSVPSRNMDGTNCKSYLSSVKLSDFGTYWGTSLTDDDFKGGNFYMIGVEQNPDDTLRGDLQSTGWLIDNLESMNDNDAIKFTNLHVIGDLSQSHVAMLCSYDWYSAFGMTDTLVVFEDISNTLKVSDFTDGDIFSATVFAHNIKIEKVNGYRVIVVEYATFD